MKQSGDRHDESIDRVFAGLRNAEAPANMEDRILRTLEARRAERAQPVWRNALPARILNATSTANAVTGMALASALTMLLLVQLFVRSTHRFEVAPAQSQQTAPPIASKSPDPLEAPPRDTVRLLPARILRVKLVPSAPRAEPISDEDALAFEEMLAPSKPAPPLPLTHQEVLMMRILRHGAREEQLAMLDPAVRARDAEQSEAEFHTFFDPPLLNPNE